MATYSVDKEHWERYFDDFSRVAGAQLVELEIAGLDLGDQLEAEWLPLTGISYDARDDVLTVQLDDKLDHMIRAPRAVSVEEEADGVRAIDVVDGDGRHQIIKLRTPLGLPRPA